VFLAEPGHTAYDLKFSFLGFPVRVHPAFFILPVLFSQGFISPQVNAGVAIIIMIAVFFIGVLIHEIGHTLAFRYYGIPSHVVLYWMGGLAIPGGGSSMPWKSARTRSLQPNEQIVVSAAGPIAGLLLAGVFVLLLIAMGCPVRLGWIANVIPVPRFSVAGTFLADYPALVKFFEASILINIFLNVFNLLPVFPLDGGQIARQLFVKADPWGGVRKSVILSMAVAVFIALISLNSGDRFLAFFFGFMAWNNYQLLSQSGNSRRPW
jgi:Zn-dependent protease